MQDSNEIKEILISIRDTQHEHLAEYRRVTERSLELQQLAVNRQEHVVKLYRRVLGMSAVLFVFIVILLIYLLGKLR
jgi:hypothetical protein